MDTPVNLNGHLHMGVETYTLCCPRLEHIHTYTRILVRHLRGTPNGAMKSWSARSRLNSFFPVDSCNYGSYENFVALNCNEVQSLTMNTLLLIQYSLNILSSTV